jgi:uncharacterized OB-fold protein
MQTLSWRKRESETHSTCRSSLEERRVSTATIKTQILCHHSKSSPNILSVLEVGEGGRGEFWLIDFKNQVEIGQNHM